MKSVVILCFFIAGAQLTAAQSNKTVLAIVAHPDDETALAEVLVKLQKAGNSVHLVIATDGKDGTRVTTIPAGDSLGNLRKEESRCACRILGINDPVFLGIERLDTRHGVGTYFNSHKRLLVKLRELVSSLNPDFIITFGPDGDTHHAEHIVIGAAVTELLLMEGWVERYPLYYIAWSRSQGELFDLGFVHEKYSNVEIEYSQDDENKALEIMPCYPTQYTAEEIKIDREKKLADKSNFLNFRKLAVASGKSHSFR